VSAPAPEAWLFPPLLPKEALRGPVLALAAHPDDEVIACGAMLAFHARRGDRVVVIHATDGAAGDPAGRFQDIALVRQAEGRKALAALGVTELEGWALPDGGLSGQGATLREKVADAFRRIQPGTVYAFSPFEYHPDHRAVGEAVVASWQALPAAARVLLYGVNHPALPGILLDTTALVETKRRALGCFASQLAYNDFSAKAIARDFSATVNVELREVTHAEAFVDLRPDELPRLQALVHPLLSFLFRTRQHL
jgi:LmbE family N-acetylglucosaminyl deacetylase